MSELKEISSNKCFGGFQKVFSHKSKELNCNMNFSIYLPNTSEKLPVLYYLSGLTCNELNMVQKSGFQRYLFRIPQKSFKDPPGLIKILPQIRG